jgi:hypothetical protein
MAAATRKLTIHQKAVLIQVLRAFPEQRVGVEYCASAGDALAYAHDFLTIFKAVGWDVNNVEPAAQATAQAAGLEIVVSQDRRLPPGAEALRDALRIYGIEAETIWDADGDVAAGAFALRVGSDVSRDQVRE